ncbi:MAG: sensor histidine kinase [Bacilli bacterium]
MKFTQYVAGRSLFFGIMLLIWVFTLLIGSVVKIPLSVLFFLSVIWWLPIITYVLIEWWRMNSWLSSLRATQQQLEQKYLLFNVLKQPTTPELCEIHEQLQEAYRDMHEHINGYKYAQKAYKEYIEMWVHEIKTPIAASELLLANHDFAASGSLKEELRKVDGFVEQALYYSKIEYANDDYRIKQVSVKTFVHNVIKQNARMFIGKGIGLSVEVEGISVYTDEKWTEFILQQIISNAINYSKVNGATLKIVATQLQQSVKLTIEDNGIGIPSGELQAIFQKGYTGSNGRKIRKSTGMGLYIVEKLAQKLNIGIGITSVVSEGTRVELTFPISNVFFRNEQ